MKVCEESKSVPLIVGQGLAGTCLAWEFLERGMDFRIVDRGGGSSRVAAGLINPITGKNFEPSWKIEEFYDPAIRLYEKLGTQFGEAIWHPMPLLRLAESDKEWQKISSKLEMLHVKPWMAEYQESAPAPYLGAASVRGAGWLDTKKFLQFSALHFQQLGKFSSETENSFLIRCEGAEGLLTGDFGNQRCAKGEILTIRADWPQTHIRIGAGGWFIPIGEQMFRIGSTYEWDQLDEAATEAGRDRIFRIVEKLGGADFEVIDHVAGIRPIMRKSQPLIGKDWRGNWFFNGLGSKGTLYAPRMAKILVDWFFEGILPDAEFVFSPTESV